MASGRDDEILRALCEALVPPQAVNSKAGALFDASGSSLETSVSVEKGLEKLAPVSRRSVRRLMRIVDNPLASLLWLGRWARFSRLSNRDAVRFLEALSTSRVSVVRRTFDILKRVIIFHAYGSETAIRAIWEDRGYPFVKTRTSSPPLSGNACPDRCETVVVGSGAGGAVSAAILAGKGHDVLVLEKGPEVAPSAMDGVETNAMHAMFEQGGLLTTADGGISLFAGSCLGGGTTVNWSASFRLPDEIRHVWNRVYGIDWMGESDFDRAYDYVESRTGVGEDWPSDNAPNAALRNACNDLGLNVKVVPRNTRGCRGDDVRHCGRCGLGCAHDRKQGTTATFLRDVKERGGSIVTGATVRRVVVDGGRVRGVEVEISTPSGTETRRIQADRVILAAGALHTPAILLRSGLTHNDLGRNLCLHPTVGVAGRYAKAMNGWEGSIMSSYTDAFAWLDGPWGVRIETAPIYPGLLASALPWNSAQGHRQDLDLIEKTAAFIVLTRDRSGGKVVLDRMGDPKIHYRISDPDLAMLITGVVETARMHLAAGAESILFPHSERKVLAAHGGEERIADLAREIFTWGWRPGLFPLFSAHQMGTCRMGGNVESSPVDLEGRVRGVEGLYVSDASLFPEAAGVNPALTVQATAYCVASQIA
jgi:choline dehydrogenase-like flavoprotein